MKRALYVVVSVLFALQVWAESDETVDPKTTVPAQGPHQGKLVSAGNFQLELVWQSDASLKVYLLDDKYENETTENSEVGIFIQSGNIESEMSCQVVENHFQCQQNGKKFKKGTLAISAKRRGQQAEEVKVDVPFENKSDKKNVKDVKKKK